MSTTQAPLLPRQPNRLRRLRSLNEIGMLVCLLILVGVFSQLAPNFLTDRNLINILRSASYVGIVAFPMTFVIIAGEIDISVGPAVAFAGVLFAMLVGPYGWPLPIAALATLAVGMAHGFAAGLMRVRYGVPTFIATLALWSSLRGLALWWTNALPAMIPSKEFRGALGGDLFGLPVVTWVMLLVLVLFWYLSRYTAYGRSVYAVGGNAAAAKLSGVKVDRVRIGVMMTTGFFAALCGILIDARLGSGNASAADGLEFDVIAAVVVGGTLLSGGAGQMIGTLLGVLVIAVLSNGLVLMGVVPDVQKVVRGLVILLAVLLNAVIVRRAASGH